MHVLTKAVVNEMDYDSELALQASVDNGDAASDLQDDASDGQGRSSVSACSVITTMSNQLMGISVTSSHEPADMHLALPCGCPESVQANSLFHLHGISHHSGACWQETFAWVASVTHA